MTILRGKISVSEIIQLRPEKEVKMDANFTWNKCHSLIFKHNFKPIINFLKSALEMATVLLYYSLGKFS